MWILLYYSLFTCWGVLNLLTFNKFSPIRPTSSRYLRRYVPPTTLNVADFTPILVDAPKVKTLTKSTRMDPSGETVPGKFNYSIGLCVVTFGYSGYHIQLTLSIR